MVNPRSKASPLRAKNFQKTGEFLAVVAGTHLAQRDTGGLR
jgi:hypothetical protein